MISKNLGYITNGLAIASVLFLKGLKVHSLTWYVHVCLGKSHPQGIKSVDGQEKIKKKKKKAKQVP